VCFLLQCERTGRTPGFSVRVLLLQDLLQKLFACGGGESGGHVLRETTSRGLCGLGLVCPSRTSEQCVCLLLPIIELCAGGGGDSEGHVL
jgi:hypothetical protein